jgi:hypothetical protein
MASFAQPFSLTAAVPNQVPITVSSVVGTIPSTFGIPTHRELTLTWATSGTFPLTFLIYAGTSPTGPFTLRDTVVNAVTDTLVGLTGT